jgi:hypothetical protein
MRRLLWAIPVALFFLNPSFACGPAEPEFRYGATEMRAAVEGNWSFTIMPEGASGPIQVTVNVAQAAASPGGQAQAPWRGLVRPAYACGSRTLVKSASACIDVTTMPLAVTYVLGDASFASAPMSGTFEVMGTEFQTAASTMLELVLGDYRVRAQVSPDRTVVNPYLGPAASGAAAGTLTIVTRS